VGDGTWPRLGSLPRMPVKLENVGIAVRDLDDLDEALEIAARHGCQPLRGVATYEETYRLTYVRGPSGIIVMLAEELKKG
jgi:glyoxylase I family protein